VVGVAGIAPWEADAAVYAGQVVLGALRRTSSP